MSEHDILDDIEREHRRERIVGFFQKNALWLALLVGGLLAGSALYTWHEARQRSYQAYYSDAYEKGRELLTQGEGDEGLRQLRTVASEGPHAYRAMARMVMAQYHMMRGRTKKAAEEFALLAQDKKVAAFYQGLAQLNLLSMNVDQKSPQEIIPLLDLVPFEVRGLALELKGFMLYQLKDFAQARDTFLQAAQTADPYTQQRAQNMVRWITLTHLQR